MLMSIVAIYGETEEAEEADLVRTCVQGTKHDMKQPKLQPKLRLRTRVRFLHYPTCPLTRSIYGIAKIPIGSRSEVRIYTACDWLG